MPNTPPSKAVLRTELRARRHALGPQGQAAAATAVAGHFVQLPCWSQTRRIAVYIARDGEVDTLPLVALCRKQGMQVFLPVMGAQNTLSFARWDEDAQLIGNSHGIPEPAADALRLPVAQLDTLVLPLVGWDRYGGRLGMGGGYYDRTLAGCSTTTLVGLAHSVQELQRVPMEGWDIPLNFVVTENALHHCQGND